MLLFIKYNLRDVYYDINALEEAPVDFVCPNHRTSPVPIIVVPNIDMDDVTSAVSDGNESGEDIVKDSDTSD